MTNSKSRLTQVPCPPFSSSNQTQVSALQALNRSINQHKCIKGIDFDGTPAKGVRLDDFNYEIDVGGRRREIARKGNQKRREEKR